MTSRHAWSRIGRWLGAGLLLVMCVQSAAGAEPVADTGTLPDELLTAQNLSKVITSNQWYAVGGGVVVLAVLMAIAYLVPLIRAPRWQIFGFALVPALAALGTMVALSRPIEPELQKITHEELEKVAGSEVAEPGDKAVAKKILKWQGEIEGRSFLIDVSSMPMSATLGASAALMVMLWLLSHRRVLRAN